MTSTAAHTITNAISVPMLTRSARIFSGKSAPTIATSDAGQDRRLVRRAEARVDGAEEVVRDEPVARHGEQDARLAQQQHEQHARDADDGAERDEEHGDRQAALRRRRCATGASMSIWS